MLGIAWGQEETCIILVKCTDLSMYLYIHVKCHVGFRWTSNGREQTFSLQTVVTGFTVTQWYLKIVCYLRLWYGSQQNQCSPWYFHLGSINGMDLILYIAQKQIPALQCGHIIHNNMEKSEKFQERFSLPIDYVISHCLWWIMKFAENPPRSTIQFGQYFGLNSPPTAWMIDLIIWTGTC